MEGQLRALNGMHWYCSSRNAEINWVFMNKVSQAELTSQVRQSNGALAKSDSESDDEHGQHNQSRDIKPPARSKVIHTARHDLTDPAEV